MSATASNPSSQQPSPRSQPQLRRREKAEALAERKRFEGKVVLISSALEGIGRFVADAFAREGADVCAVYPDHDPEQAEAARRIQEDTQSRGRKCVLQVGDPAEERACRQAVDRTIKQLGRLDVLICNATDPLTAPTLEDITHKQLERHFRANLFSMFYFVKAAVKHLPSGSGSVIYTTSPEGMPAGPGFLDDSATKGAIVALTRSLSRSLADRGIRVNAVAPGPIWTPGALVPPLYPPDSDWMLLKHTSPIVEPSRSSSLGIAWNFSTSPAPQPLELAGCYTFLASKEASYITGQVLQPNGGNWMNT